MTSVSGVEVPDAIQAKIKALIKKEHQYLVYCLRPDNETGKLGWTEIGVGERLPGCARHGTCNEAVLKEGWETFTSEYMKGDEAVWALYDWTVVPDLKMKIVCVQWCPDDLNVGKKMKYASSVGALKNLSEQSSQIAIKNEPNEVTFEEIKKEFAGKK